MTEEIFDQMGAEIARATLTRPIGKIVQIAAGTISIEGLSMRGRVGDQIQVIGSQTKGEIVRTSAHFLEALMDGSTEGLGLGEDVVLSPRAVFAPHFGWIGRVVDPDGKPLDGRPLLPGKDVRSVSVPPPPASMRRELGARLSSGFAIFDTILPIVRGQRIGLFAGSGVGKSTLLSSLAKKVEADIIVIGLVGERGRELREFVEAKSQLQAGKPRIYGVTQHLHRPQ